MNLSSIHQKTSTTLKSQDEAFHSAIAMLSDNHGMAESVHDSVKQLLTKHHTKSLKLCSVVTKEMLQRISEIEEGKALEAIHEFDVWLTEYTYKHLTNKMRRDYPCNHKN